MLLAESKYEQSMFMAMKAVIKDLYPDLSYHNLRHADGAFETSMKDAQLCQRQGLAVRTLGLGLGMLGHDLLFEIPLEPGGYRSKEHRSADFTRQILERLGVPEPEIAVANEVIIATELGEKPRTLESKIGRRADLDNLNDPFAMINATHKIWREQGQLGNPQPLEETAKSSYEILSEYLEDDVCYGNFDRGPSGQSLFTEKALANIEYLNPPRFLKIIKQLGLSATAPELA